ncbi:MAG: hypothetical protein RBT80_09080 [Candidatus Vecturithrix sp.]|nr:hypothetical protein [Candidatus Vecturithrix sp.]
MHKSAINNTVPILFVFCLVFAPYWASAAIDSGEVPADYMVWSSWYWPFHDAYNPNLYDPNEAMARYDLYDVGARAQEWEYQHHGPPQNPEPWWGHCHAWSGAACWEKQPTADKTLNGVTFRIRDQKGLLIEKYHKCADGISYEIFANDPSPGLFWRYLRNELRGDNAMHGHGMGFAGELYYGASVWNYPIYKYEVTYSDSSPYSGTMKIWVAADGQPSYADSTSLHSRLFTYEFEGIKGDGTAPIDSGTWIGSGPHHRPDAIWRPYPPSTWMEYVENSELDEVHLKAILSERSSSLAYKTFERTVVVPGATRWQDSGMAVSAGDILTFTAQGTVVYSPVGYACGPAGTTWSDIRDQKDPIWNRPHAALIGKIGEAGAPFLIGERLSFQAGSGGKLFLGINDYWYYGNCGKFTVNIRRRSSGS